MTLTGTASLADYQRAIQAVTFSNNSNNPVAGNRVIEVTVNDGFMNSNVANDHGQRRRCQRSAEREQ